MLRMADRVVLITGAGGDLGRGMVMRFAEEGAWVAASDIDLARAEETADLVTGSGGKAIAYEADLTVSEQVDRMVARVITDLGRVDVLINNAGDIRDALVTKMSDDDWDFVVDLNLKGSFLCARAVIPHMIERGAGRIVNIGSMAYKGNIGQANYVSAKAGVVGLTQALGLELARHNITVNCVAPGIIDTPKSKTLTPEVRDRLVRCTPMRRMGETVDIANAALYFASDEAKYVTRQILHVSGGLEGF